MVIRPANTTHIKNSALIGMILGDGSMQNGNVLYIRHGGKQLDYVNEKVLYLSKYLKPKSIRESTDKLGYKYRYSYYNDKSLKYLYKLIYGEKRKKRITRKIMNRFNEVSLSFLYMDDGCLSLRKYINKDNVWPGTYRSREIHLNIQAFTFNEAIMLQSCLKRKFNLIFRLTKDKGRPRLWCNTENTKKFVNIVSPIVEQFNTMRYKIDLKY